ncbi:hypothetical protein NLG97_g2627 [Lecanicillium saksenae]|uniref:Uncharacterized protein n=1 Tax=Lecanicillium saksenae TaxID=468837 RepID=A0ACC1R0L8_9HYPO|nr:hypothetical protein NLG97_g2627 [Lecanicillium saksenae]
MSEKSQAAAWAQDGGDAAPALAIKPQARKPYDPDVTFEEYHHYAKLTRAEQLTLEPPVLNVRAVFGGGGKDKATEKDESANFKLTAKDFTPENRAKITDEEWANASRAMRTASSGACFYLITTDVLGPWGSGFAMGTLGWGPGIAFYVSFGLLAGYSGYLIYRMYLGMDSYQFPVKNYGDLGYRTMGPFGRHIANVSQALSLVMLVGQITLQFGLNISQVSKFRLCYAVCPVIFACVGFFLTQIRTLKSYGWIANTAVWLNVFILIMTVGVIASSPPNYAISTLGSAGSAVDPSTIKPVDGVYPPIMHYNSAPTGGLVGSINGMMTGVLAYTGAQLFVEFMAEMRRPMDFLKAMWGAQTFICCVYLVYGCIVYKLQGQYAFNPAYQGVSIYAWQTVGNMVTVVSALICAGLYANIGIKVVYNNVFIDLFNAPPIGTKPGKIIYASIVPIWWAIAWVIAAAIPDFFGFVSVMSASVLVNLTYGFPPLFALCFDVQRHAIREGQGEGFNPQTGETIRRDSAWKHWVRGFLSGGTLQVALNVWHAVFFIGALVMCGLGMYAAIEGLIEAFKLPHFSSFSCQSPLNLNAQP